MNFQEFFHLSPDVVASAPGRVNLLGEHTDYNDGFVLPTAIPQTTTVQLGLSHNGHYHFYSKNVDEYVSLSDLHSIPSGFASYLVGCLLLLQHRGYTIPALNIYVYSTVPLEAGLSSSAALEVSFLRGLRQLFHLNIDDVEIAQLAQQAEIHYAGVQCGIMDQMASSLADTAHLLFLDTRTLERQVLPFPNGGEIVVIDSGVPRRLASSGYNQRRTECEMAAKMLEVKALRDIKKPEQVETLPEPFRRRVRHVVTENNRVLEVRSGVSLERFGELMNASHISLRDDYEASVPALDHLVEILQQTPGVFGARLTGAGFGGSCVALVAAQQAREIAIHTLDQYTCAGHQGRILIPVIESTD